MTQDKLAEALFVSRQTIYKWESGKALPDINRLQKMCLLFHVSLNDLLEIDLPENKAESVSEGSARGEPKEKVASINYAKRRMLRLLICAVTVIGCVLLVLILVRQPKEIRQAMETANGMFFPKDKVTRGKQSSRHIGCTARGEYIKSAN